LARVIGITGGIGTGKSTVVRMLTELGASSVSADEIARDVLARGTEAYAEVVARFGRGVLTPEGEIDRGALARIIFADAEARAALDAITHPRIISAMAEHIRRFRAAPPSPDAVLAAEIPLLIECGMEHMVDEVVVVAAEQETQMGRLTTRSGIPYDEAFGRIAAQMPLSEKIRRADRVIRNDGSVDELRRSVEALWREVHMPRR